MHPKDSTFTIRRAEFSGKWIACWWVEIPAPDDPFEYEPSHFSSKIGYYDSAIDAAKLGTHVLNHGVRGLKVTIKGDHIESISL